MGKDLNKQLVMAVKIGSQSQVERLLVEGANPNAKDEEGQSALNWAKALPASNAIKSMLDASTKSYAEACAKKKLPDYILNADKTGLGDDSGSLVDA